MPHFKIPHLQSETSCVGNYRVNHFSHSCGNIRDSCVAIKAKFTNEVQENIFLKNKNKYFYMLLEVGNNFRSEAQRSYSDFQ